MAKKKANQVDKYTWKGGDLRLIEKAPTKEDAQSKSTKKKGR